MITAYPHDIVFLEFNKQDIVLIEFFLKYRRKSPDVSPWMEWVPKSSDRYDRIKTWISGNKPTVPTGACIISSGSPDTDTKFW